MITRAAFARFLPLVRAVKAGTLPKFCVVLERGQGDATRDTEAKPDAAIWTNDPVKSALTHWRQAGAWHPPLTVPKDYDAVLCRSYRYLEAIQEAWENANVRSI